jgi:hypothetical protein
VRAGPVCYELLPVVVAAAAGCSMPSTDSLPACMQDSAGKLLRHTRRWLQDRGATTVSSQHRACIVIPAQSMQSCSVGKVLAKCWTVKMLREQRAHS